MFKGMKIYIAGPITGIDDYKERFIAVEKYLRDQGAIPMHSANLPQGFDLAQYLYICFAMIDVCEAVYFMDGYSESEGAKKEFCYAALKNKQLLYENIDPAWKFDNAEARLKNRILYGSKKTIAPTDDVLEQLESGKITLNEAREKYDLNAIDQADEKLVKLDLMEGWTSKVSETTENS